MPYEEDEKTERANERSIQNEMRSNDWFVHKHTPGREV